MARPCWPLRARSLSCRRPSLPTLSPATVRAFDPWIGDRYASEGLGGRRVLVLGESHYSKEAPYAGFTRYVVQKAVDGERYRYFAGVLRTIFGSPSAGARGGIWHHLAFSNLVQDFLPGPGKRPTKAMWARGRAALPETVEEVRPDVVLVTGIGLGRQVARVSLPGGATVHTIRHPSSPGFDWRAWHPGVRAALWGDGPVPEVPGA